MTVSTTTNKIIYAGLIGQTVFAYNFRVDQKLDMNVILDSVLIPQGDWAIDGLGNDVGGNVTLNDPLVADVSVTLLREVAETQLVDYQPFDAFPAETHEGALDKLTMITQQLAEQLDRAAKLPLDTTLDDYDLGTPVANEVIMYNATEDGQTSSGIDATAFNANVQAAADSATAAAASEDKAQEWAENPEDDPVETGPDQFSAFHWAQKAMASINWDSYLDGYLISSLHSEYTSDLNNIIVNSKYYIDSTAVTGEPVDFIGLGVVETDMWATDETQAVQLITSMDIANNGKAWVRQKQANVWGDWQPFGAGGAVITDTAPANPNVGDSWWDNDLGVSFIWYDDGDSQQWVQQEPAKVTELWTIFYGRVQDSDGALLNSNGGVSVVRDGTGAYTLTFDTPLPDSNYSVQLSGSQNISNSMSALTQTTVDFEVRTWDITGAAADRSFYFTVTRQANL